MSAIKPFSSKNTVSDAVELPIGRDPSGQRYRQSMIASKNKPFCQQLAMRMANVLVPNIDVKSEGRGHLVAGTDDPRFSLFTDVALPILQADPVSIFCQMSSGKGAVEPDIQIDTPLELGDEIELCNQQEAPRDYGEFDDEPLLLNMSGMPFSLINNTAQKPNSVLISLAKEEGNSLKQPIMSQADDQIIASPLLLKQASKGVFFVKKAPMVLAHEHHQAEKTTPSLSAITRLTAGMQESKPIIEQGNIATADHDIAAKLSPAITEEHVIQNLTKSEKKQPFLQENENIDVVNISRNSSVPTEIGTLAQPQLQTSVTREPSSVASQVDKWGAHRAAIEDFHIKETLPRTLTYTFHQWKNTPSVTFELATKTEFIATTQSYEVQQTLQENKHLLSGEKHIYFRQEQDGGQQHRRQQEQHQQEED